MDIDVVIVAGGPRRSLLELQTGWPLFRLPVEPDRSLLAVWKAVIEDGLSTCRGIRPRSWRVLLSDGRGSDVCAGDPDVQIVLETRSHRGLAGAIYDDLCSTDSASPLVLIIELSASPGVELTGLFAAWDAIDRVSRAGVIGESSLGRYCGVALCHRSVFELVPEFGFFDFKEQLLPAIHGAGGQLRPVVIADRARRIRTRQEWLEAVTTWQEIRARPEPSDDRASKASRQGGGRSLIDPGAVTDGARIVSSIVMEEAVVEPGAVVARSVIGPGLRVPARARIIDSMVADPVVGRAVLQRRDAGVVFREAVG